MSSSAAIQMRPRRYSPPVGLPSDLTQEEISSFLAKPKFVDDDLEWRAIGKGNVRLAVLHLKDSEGKTIIEHTVELQHRTGRYQDECKYTFTIFRLVPRKTRLYQIEVAPKDHKSHAEAGKGYYGPHQHFGDRYETLEESRDLGCKDFEDWFRVFLKRANIGFSGTYSPPDKQWRLFE